MTFVGASDLPVKDPSTRTGNMNQSQPKTTLKDVSPPRCTYHGTDERLRHLYYYATKTEYLLSSSILYALSPIFSKLYDFPMTI